MSVDLRVPAIGEPVLVVEGLRKRYGSAAALDGIDLRVDAGTIMATLGPNGAGKTTLARTIAGLTVPDSGSVHIMGIDALRHGPSAREYLGYVSQEVAVYPGRTVLQNLEFFGRLAGLGRAELGRRVDELAAALLLDDLLDRRAGILSGGQCRRLHTALALVGRPALVMLDEPTAGVDIETRSALIALVRRLADDGAAICYTTHYLPEVEQLSAEVTMIDRGTVIGAGHVDDLVRIHGQAIVAIGFDGDVPFIEGAEVDVASSTARITCESPGFTAAQVLHHLGPDADRVTTIDVVQPSLESAYYRITGNRFSADGGEAPVTPDEAVA